MSDFGLLTLLVGHQEWYHVCKNLTPAVARGVKRPVGTKPSGSEWLLRQKPKEILHPVLPYFVKLHSVTYPQT